MAAATTLSSSPSLHFINGSHRFISATPFSFESIFLRRRIRRLNRSFASYRGSQSRRRYDSEDRFFNGYEYDVVHDDDGFSDDDDDEEDERESSVDLLIRFVRSMFKKVSKRAKKASRRILPAAMSPRLVSFAVDGILLLGSLSITRAFLEVCLTCLKALLKDFGVESSKPMIMHCDNQAAIHIATNAVFHERTKHIELDCHKVREKIEEGVIIPYFTRSRDQLADILTKAASPNVCQHIHQKLGLVDLTRP